MATGAAWNTPRAVEAIETTMMATMASFLTGTWNTPRAVEAIETILAAECGS